MELIKLFFISCLMVFMSSNALGQEYIEPGETVTFTEVDGGDRNCRRGRVEGATERFNCRGSRFLGTVENPNEKRIRTRVALGNLNVTVGVPYYATVRLFKDIHINGSPDNLVPVQFSTIFDYRNFFLMAAAYTLDSTVYFRVTDRSTGKDVATHTLFETSRDGDQGLTDIAFGSERRFLTDLSGSFTLLLRRGREYRLTIELESMSQVPVLGRVETDSRVDLKSITISIDEDEIDALDEHDFNVQTSIANHDSAIRTQVGQHDSDIKALLTELQDGQQEIIRLLLTPHGRRESEQGDFPIKK